MMLKLITKYEHISHWLKPQERWCTLNVDASINERTGKIGAGWVARDSNGDPLLLSSIVLDGRPTINAAELISLEEGLSGCLSIGMKKILIETDTTTFHKVSNDILRDMSSGEISEDFPEYLKSRAGCRVFSQSTHNIRAMIMELEGCCMRKIHREANYVADHLAKMGRHDSGRTDIILPNEMTAAMLDLVDRDRDASRRHTPVDCEDERDNLWKK